MQVEQTKIPGVLILTPRRFNDSRGFFEETWSQSTSRENGLDISFVQDNHSYSKSKNTLRGLHYQAPPYAQAKLVSVLRGSIIDVAVDIRQGSSHFGESVRVELSAANGRQLYIPTGFLHGFCTCEDHTDVFYKCSNFYMANYDGSIAFDDPELNIDWGIDRTEAILSDKDASAPRLADTASLFKYEVSV